MDTEKHTELFKVPAHGSVDHSNILHDFKKVSLVQWNLDLTNLYLTKSSI